MRNVCNCSILLSTCTSGYKKETNRLNSPVEFGLLLIILTINDFPVNFGDIPLGIIDVNIKFLNLCKNTKYITGLSDSLTCYRYLQLDIDGASTSKQNLLNK